MRFVPFPAPSSSGDQVVGEHSVPGGLCVLITSPVLEARFPGCAVSTISVVLCISSGELFQDAILLADSNHPGSQEDLISNWEPAHSLVEDAVSGAEIAPCLPALAVAHLPLCLRPGEGLVLSRLALLWYSLNPLFCEQVRLCLRLEPFSGKFSLSPFLFLWLYSLGCYFTLASSGCPQGIQAQSLP